MGQETFALTVPAALQAFTPGPLIRFGDTVDVSASGAVVFGLSDGVPSFAFPEGGYYPDFPNSHAYDPAGVATYAQAGGAGYYLSSDTVPLALVMFVFPAGQPAGFGRNLTGAMLPLRDKNFGFPDLYAGGLTDPNKVYQLYFAFNDDNYPDNSGSMAVTCVLTVPGPGPQVMQAKSDDPNILVLI